MSVSDYIGTTRFSLEELELVLTAVFFQHQTNIYNIWFVITVNINYKNSSYLSIDLSILYIDICGKHYSGTFFTVNFSLLFIVRFRSS